MTKFQKLVKRICSKPRDFTWEEALVLLSGYGYEQRKKGKTGGSRRAFIHPETKHIIFFHQPHPGNILKPYQVNILIEQLHINCK